MRDRRCWQKLRQGGRGIEKAAQDKRLKATRSHAKEQLQQKEIGTGQTLREEERGKRENHRGQACLPLQLDTTRYMQVCLRLPVQVFHRKLVLFIEGAYRCFVFHVSPTKTARTSMKATMLMSCHTMHIPRFSFLSPSSSLPFSSPSPCFLSEYRVVCMHCQP